MSKEKLTREIDWLLREKYDGRRGVAAERDIARLRRGEHVSYLIGWTPFLGCRIDLSTRPLIPRPETEYWTEKAIEMIKRSGSSQPRVLDIFCGSGCIGVAVLKYVPVAQVHFADIEREYFTGIRKSLRLNRVDGRRAQFLASDVFKDLGARKYDLILANPPYISQAGRRVSKSVLEQEPRGALFAGKDGLKYIRQLLRGGKKHLEVGGAIMVEFDPPQRPAIAKYAREHRWKSEFFRDQHGRWRFGAFTPAGQR